MRFTRHAKNRLRWIRRTVSGLDENDLIEALAQGTTIGRDARDNRQVRVAIEGLGLILVVDEEAEMVVTIWREE